MRDRIGEKFESKYGKYEIVEHAEGNRWIIEFEEMNGVKYRCEREYGCIKSGVRNPFKVVYANVGFIGDFKHIYNKSPSKERLYNVWGLMISRCYNVNNPRYQAYGGKNVTVCSDWHNFTTFYKEVQEVEGWTDEIHLTWCKELDKDFKQSWGGDKIYSKDTCVWRDKEENNEDQGHQIPVTCINTGESFRNLARASKWRGAHYSGIHKCAKGKASTAGRHPKTNEVLRWKFKES